jgi:glutamine synthetase
VDSSANPYLAVSGILASGLSGIESNAPLIEAEDANIFDLTDAEKVKRNLTALPESLLEARSEFLKDEVLRSAVSERIASFLVSR